MNKEYGKGRSFAWQTGYGAFSVSHSNAPAVVKYIQAQEEHHKKVSFQEEFVQFLKRNGVQYDERYLWEWTPYEIERNDLPPRPGLLVVLWFRFPGLAPWARIYRPSGAGPFPSRCSLW